MESEVITLKASLQEKEAQLKAVQLQFEEFKTDTVEYEKELEADNKHKEKDIATMTSKLETTTKKLDEYKKESAYLSSTLEKEKKKLEQVELEFKDCQARIVYLEQDNVSHESEIRNLRFEKDDLQIRYDKLEENSILEMEQLCNQFSQKIEALERLRQEMVEYQDEIAVLKKQNEDLTQEKEIRGSVENLQEPEQDDQFKQLEEIILHYRAEVEVLNKGLEERAEDIKQYEAQMNIMQEEIENLNEKLRQKELDEIDEGDELEKTKLEIQILRETLEETDKQIQELNVKLNVSHISQDRSRDYGYDQNFLDRPDISSRDLEAMKKSMKEMGTEIASLSEKVKCEKETNMKLQRENEKYQKEAKAKEKRLASQKTELTELKSSLVNERTKNTELEKRLAKITREMEEKVKKIGRATKEPPVLKKGTETERKHLRTPDTLVRDFKPDTPNNGGDSTQILLTDGDNESLAERLNKMAYDIEILTNKMLMLQHEKNKLEQDVAQREEIINDLIKKYQQNNELIDYVQKLTHENNCLSDKLSTMMGDVETLATRTFTIQNEKLKLEEDMMYREKVIDDLTARYQENNGLLELVKELEDENSRLRERLANMAGDVGILSNKFIELNEYKLQLEADAIQREAAITELERRYQGLAMALQGYKKDQNEGISARTSPAPQQQESIRKGSKDNIIHNKDVHLEIEVDNNKLPEKAVITSDYQLIKNKTFKSFGVYSTLSPTLTNSYSHFDIMDSTTKIEASKNTTSESCQQLAKVVKFLYTKKSRASLLSSLRIDGNQVTVLDSTLAKSSRTTSGYTVRGEKSITFNGIAKDPKVLGLKSFNLRGENILGRSLFFFIYGARGTDKKILKQTLVQEVIETLKYISKQNPDKECRLIIRIQDEKLFNKLETSNNYKALEQFTTHQEFILGEEQQGPLENMLAQLKHFDSQKATYSAESPIREKPTTKEIFIEFLMQSREEGNESGSEYPCSGYLTRTKIMIVTTNNTKEAKDLEGLAADDSLIDLILSDRKGNNLDQPVDNEKKVIPNNIEKFFVFTIKPEIEPSKTISNTLALAMILDDLSKSQKNQAIQNKGKFSTPSPKKVRKGIDSLNIKTTPSGKDKFAHLTILQNYETPKGKTKEISFDIKVPERIPPAKSEKASTQESQKLVQQIEDYSKMNPGGRSNMKRLLGALTQMTPTNQSYRTKHESKSTVSDRMSSIVTPSRNRRGTKGFDFDCSTKKEVTVLE